MRAFAILLACAPIAACGSEPEAPRETVENAEQEVPAAAPGNQSTSLTHGNESDPASPEPAPIPAAFRGIWAEAESLCADLAHPSRLVISGATLRFHESVAEVARVDRIGPREINIIGTAPGEGTSEPAEHHFSIDAAGETLTDQGGGGTVRRRCDN